jgi:hypothetical protein
MHSGSSSQSASYSEQRLTILASLSLLYSFYSYLVCSASRLFSTASSRIRSCTAGFMLYVVTLFVLMNVLVPCMKDARSVTRTRRGCVKWVSPSFHETRRKQIWHLPFTALSRKMQLPECELIINFACYCAFWRYGLLSIYLKLHVISSTRG